MNTFSLEIFDQNYKGPGETTVQDMFNRQAVAINSIEITDHLEYFKEILNDFHFIPGGRILANLGIPGRESTTLYNCFVHQTSDIKLNDPDSIFGIFDMLKYQAKTLASEGGKHA